MKKFLALVLTLALALGCAAAMAEATTQVASYVIYNGTGETVTELTLTENKENPEVINLLDGEDTETGLAANGYIAFTNEYPADVEAHGYFTLAFKTESGYEGSFATLSIEEAPITLLAADQVDAVTAPTMITFKVLNWPCAYTIYNVTGETVTELTLTDNVTAEVTSLLADGATLADGESIDAALSVPVSEEAHGRLTLTFKTESGYEGHFDTLSIEVAPISLLAASEVDAVTAPTMISFKAPEGK